jgi:MoxR-like ATPase
VRGGERQMLVIGNQGVGKNVLVDRLLQLMRREREYIQLHRDTTVPTLTLNPSLLDGRIVWEDSPLVRAMSSGHVLVVDEFDKAPVEVSEGGACRYKPYCPPPPRAPPLHAATA